MIQSDRMSVEIKPNNFQDQKKLENHMDDDAQSANDKIVDHAKWAVSIGFAAQGLGYATVMTALPSIKSKFKLLDDQLSIIILGGIYCLCIRLITCRSACCQIWFTSCHHHRFYI